MKLNDWIRAVVVVICVLWIIHIVTREEEPEKPKHKCAGVIEWEIGSEDFTASDGFIFGSSQDVHLYYSGACDRCEDGE